MFNSNRLQKYIHQIILPTPEPNGSGVFLCPKFGQLPETFDTSSLSAVRITCCICILHVIASHYIAPQCLTRPTSVGLFLFGQLPESYDTCSQSSVAPNTFRHVPMGFAYKMSPYYTSGNCPKHLIPVPRVVLRP